MRPALDGLFAPRRVAVVGASSDPHKVAGRPARYMAARGFQGEVYGVNPSQNGTETRLACASIDALPDGVDVAILCIPVDKIVEAVAACSRRRIPFAIVFANGFADTGNFKLQEELIAVAAAGGVRLVGPNCLGVFDLKTNFMGTFASRLDTRRLAHGSIGLVSQSGAVGNAALLSFEALDIGLSAWLATGNEADIDALEGIEYMLGRDDTSMIVTMLEAVHGAGAKVKALGKISRSRGKPIVVLKSGKSDASKAAAQSHAGKIVGSHEAWSQVVRDCGWLQVESLEHLTDVALAMGKCGWRHVGDVAVLCGSGGMGGLFCDELTDFEVPLAVLGDSTRKGLSEVLPVAAGLGNPVDPTTVSEDIYYRAAELLIRDERVSTLILLVNSLARDYGSLDQRIGSLLLTASKLRTRVAISYFSPHDALPVAVEKSLVAQGALILPTGPRLARALGTIRRWERNVAADTTSLRKEVSRAATKADHATIHEVQSLVHLAPLLQQYGIETVKTVEVGTAAQALNLLGSAHTKIVLKLEGTSIAHKTEFGLVHVGLSNGAQIEAVMAQLKQLQHIHGGVIVAQPQIEECLEVIIGGLNDSELGRLITIGLGGVLVELLNEASVASCPVGEEEVMRLLARGRLAQMLAGYRGMPARDASALARMVAACSQLLCDHPEISEFELNPVMIGQTGSGAWAVDALAIIKAKNTPD